MRDYARDIAWDIQITCNEYTLVDYFYVIFSEYFRYIPEIPTRNVHSVSLEIYLLDIPDLTLNSLGHSIYIQCASKWNIRVICCGMAIHLV